MKKIVIGGFALIGALCTGCILCGIVTTLMKTVQNRNKEEQTLNQIDEELVDLLLTPDDDNCQLPCANRCANVLTRVL